MADAAGASSGLAATLFGRAATLASAWRAAPTAEPTVPAAAPPPMQKVVAADADGAAAAGSLAGAMTQAAAEALIRRRVASPPTHEADAACYGTAGDIVGAVTTQAQADALVGRRVARAFDDGMFTGTVTRARQTRADGWLWRVKYSDGDSEDLGPEELTEALADAAAHPDAEAEALGAVSLRGLPSARAEEGADADAAAAEAGAAAQQPEPAATPALQHSFKGVHYVYSTTQAGPSFSAQFCQNGGIKWLGVFPTAEAAARAYDSAARAAGRKRMNFPRAGTDEVQASRGDGVLEFSFSGSKAAARSAHFKGVTRTPAGTFEASLNVREGWINGGRHPDAAAAARAYDALVRQRGGIVVNFPRPGSGEVLAVKGRWQPRGWGTATLLPQTAGKRSRADDAATHDAAAEPEAAGAAAQAAKRSHANAPSVPDTAARSARAAKRARAAAAAAAAAWTPFTGVSQTLSGKFAATVSINGAKIQIGSYSDATAAAHAYDARVRLEGGTAVNFPRPGSGEVQAVKGLQQPPKPSVATPPPHVAGKRSRADDAATPEAAGAAAPAAKRAFAAADAGAAANAAAAADDDAATAAAASANATGDTAAALAVKPARTAAAADADTGGPAHSVADDDAAADAAAAAGAAAGAPSPPEPAAEPPSEAAAVAAFLRGIRPPLAALDDALAALPRSGICMAHLAAAARGEPSFREMMVNEAAKQLRIAAGGDRIAFMAALQALAQPRAD